MKRILLILTGGTIGSTVNNGVIDVDSIIESCVLTENYNDKDKVVFDIRRPFNILSENMTPEYWNILVRTIMGAYNGTNCNINCVESENYAGIIIAHGSDTLSYTSAVISLFFADFDIPVILTAADRPLEDPLTNGNRNFRACVDYICGGNESGVYTIYEDNKGNMNVYNSHTICEADGYLDQYHDMTKEVYGVMDDGEFLKNEKYVLPLGYSSIDNINKLYTSDRTEQSAEQHDQGIIIQDYGEVSSEEDESILNIISKKMPHKNTLNKKMLCGKMHDILEGRADMTDNVLFIRPYPGFRYDSISFESNKPLCVLHCLYHSGTADVNRLGSFIEYCNDNDVPVYIAPVKNNTETVYATHSDIIKHGAQPLYDINYETAYALLVIMSAY